jgi:putative nucleotidyltransferase with HDIG domain
MSLFAGDTRTDRTTGCLSSFGLEERLDAEVALGGRHGQPAALVLVGLGEDPWRASTLRWVAERLGECTRPGDVIARLRSGEFALLLPATVKSDALLVASRAREALASRVIPSTGVAGFPEDGVDALGLFEHAWEKLYPERDVERTAEPPRATLSWTTAFAEAQDRRMTVANHHNRLVGHHAAEIATRLGWAQSDVEMLRLAAVFHDVGKVALPDRLISKPGPLTPTEFVQVADHPVVGARMLERVEGLEPAAEWVLRSHERYDGSGYPDGLAGERIPLGARILHVAGAIDAMTSSRPYQSALSLDEALGELRRNAGTQFDPNVVAAFEGYLAEMRAPEPRGEGDEPRTA